MTDIDNLANYMIQHIDKYENHGAASVQHKHYYHCLQIAKEAYDFRTNKIGGYLKQFTRRESEAEFAQREILTQHTLGAVYNSLTAPLEKPFRVGAVVQKYDVSEDINKRVKEIDSNFYQTPIAERGVNGFLQTVFVEVTKYDPNAMIFVEWETQGENAISKAFPQLVFCNDIWNKEKENGVLKSVMRNSCRTVTYNREQSFIKDEKKIQKDSFTCEFHTFQYYTEGYITKAQRVTQDELVVISVQNPQSIIHEVERVNGDKKERIIYVISIVETKAPLNVVEVGYIQDSATYGETYITPFYFAHPYLMKIIKSNSELDLSVALHVFPQKIEYVSKCEGERKDNHYTGCFQGYTSEGGVCSSCKGSGVRSHKSAQDTKQIVFPEEPTSQNMIDINNIVTYKSPPIDIIEWLRKYVDEQLPSQVHRAVYNTDILIRQSEIIKTATEVVSDMQPIYDVLYKFDQKCGQVWAQIIKIFIALSLGDVNKAEVQYVSTKDFKMKTRDMLLNELKVLSDSGVSSDFRKEILTDIAHNIFSGDYAKIRRFEMIQAFNPFFGKTDNEIDRLISLEYTKKEDKILYANFDKIINEIESDLKDKGKRITDLKQNELKEMISGKLIVYVQDLEAQAPELNFNLS